MKKEFSNGIGWQDMRDVWRSFKVDSSYYNQSKYIDKIPFASDLFGVGPTFIYILDFFKEGYVYVSDNCPQVLGYEVEEFKNFDAARAAQNLHPEDIHFIINAEKAFLEIFSSVPIEERKLLRSSTNFRFQRKDGIYLNVLQQKVVLELTPEGYPALMMAMCSDVSFMQKSDCSFAVSLYRDDKGWVDITPEEFKGKNNLSKREEEILKMLIKGMSSKVIAEKLNISFHTVNNHRKSLLQKTTCQNTVELVGYAISNG